MPYLRTSPRSARHRGVLAGLLILVLGATSHAADPEVRKVLILQSLDRGSLVFDSITADFRAELQRRVPTVTVTEFVVAPAGFTEPPERPIIEFLQSAFADRQRPDLIVTVGGSATAFARKHRRDLFPDTPALYAATEVRFLRDAPLAANEASVTVSIDYTKVVDDILQVRPRTANLFMVLGTGPLARFWHAELERNFERDHGKLKLLWSDDLSYEQLLQRAKNLPPDTAILFISSGTFATGDWQGEQRTLDDLARDANAPMFGAQSVWLGSGIVGGRLLYIEKLGGVVADTAIRILNGEAPASLRLPPLSLGPATFDARELRDWSIPETRLPAARTILFQDPTLWESHRREVLFVLGALALQSLLIVGLLYQRRARQRAEVESRSNLALAADANRRATISALTGSIAHDLSQPLGAILLNAQTGEMLLDTNRATPEALREILSDIRTSDVRAREIIDRHRTMLRNRQLDRKPLDLHAVVRESLQLVAHDMRSRQIQLDIKVPPVPCVVAGDQVLLQQVFVNLLMNSMEAMADTMPERRRITVASDVSPDSVDVSVRDAGSGLPGQVKGELFEPFVTTKTDGMGIGLTIVRTIVEAHRGTMSALNNPEGGATFSVTLPRDRTS